MRIIDIALKMSGKENIKIDKRIGVVYIARLCFIYGIMRLRGQLCSLFYKQIASDIFVGKKVQLIEKKSLKLGHKVKIHDYCKIDALSKEGVHIGDGVILGKRTSIECTGSIQSIGKGISIGNNSTFGSDCFFGAAGGINIGDDVMGGQYIRFHSENHNFNEVDKLIREQGVKHKGIAVGNNCWIGAGVVFLDGAEIGDGCVVAANTVVTKKFPDNCVIAGIPAQIIKKRQITND